jgi:hypothetical protein
MIRIIPVNIEGTLTLAHPTLDAAVLVPFYSKFGKQ